MCELFGYNAKIEQRLSAFPEFAEFVSHSKDNPDGWGIGYYTPTARIQKQPIPAEKSKLLQEIITSDLSTKTLVAHIRHASVGGKVYTNTHPFRKRHWIFAHNGNIKDYKALSYGHFVPEGTTDSEHIFGWLLYEIEKSNKHEEQIIVEAARHLRSLGRCNFLLADGKTLYAHADSTPETKKLHYAEREEVVVVSTYPLTREQWKGVEDGALLVCRDGKVIARIK